MYGELQVYLFYFAQFVLNFAKFVLIQKYFTSICSNIMLCEKTTHHHWNLRKITLWKQGSCLLLLSFFFRYNPLLLISLDGFRADYLSYNVTPNIQRLIQEGVHTPRMLSAYPTLTFPNHYTIVTVSMHTSNTVTI